MSKWKFAARFKQSVPFRPLFNIGSLFDIQTGKYFKGQRGESILNGGVAQVEGVTGIGNSYKSTIMHYRQLQVMNRYQEATGFTYDTENSSTLARYIDLANMIDPTGELASTLEMDVGRFSLTSAEVYDGTKWFHELREMCADREKNDKKVPTPFIDKDGKPILWFTPNIGEIDSLSMFRSAAVQKKVDKGDIGESDLNTMYMNANSAKSQLVDELPILTGRSGVCLLLSAHMGSVIVMDQYNGPSKKLAGIKPDRKMKKVPENFTFLTNNLFEITKTVPLLNKTTGASEFPVNPEDDLKGNTDLMVATIMPQRTKYGCTGIPFELLISQSKGVQPTLSEFWYCKNHDRYGIGGNQVHMELDLYPGVKFTRQSIRGLINRDPKFCRAMQITSDLRQMKNLWPEYAFENITFTPTELLAKIRELGYDWDEFLGTRTYWTFDQYTNPIKFLSTEDIINIYKGTYKPYWKS